jgi:ubiquinone/menaquinone biosynthesis C-methylase UbiE
VSRFWDFQNQYEPFETIWFTRQVGKGIINFMQKQIPLEGKILDYGTGKGHLIKHLLNLKSTDVYGFDFSPESIINVERKYKQFANYKGTTLIRRDNDFTGYQSDFFDVVFLIEAIEHLTDKYIFSTLDEIKRVLKKGGYVVITTPNNENLPLQHVLCPDCGAVYHRVQHMRSFDEDSLQTLAEKQGFTTKNVGATTFNNYNTPWAPTSVLKRMVASMREKAQPHLWYVGQK